ncbi:MAG: hypothetical protein K1X89_14165 [Myxococcaceae bacterium]|nr:hypothetical protein [Myxococcaceae bacterium]
MLRLTALALLLTGCWPALPSSREGFACRVDADCAGLVCLGQVCRASESGDGGATSLRVAFYQLGYPQAWGSVATPQTVDVASLGRYSSTDAAVVRAHVAALRYAKVGAAIAFWGGPGSASDTALKTVMSQAEGEPVRWAVYDQEEDGKSPSTAQVRATLDAVASDLGKRPNYLHLGGRPVVWVRFGPEDTSCAAVERTLDANDAGVALVLKVFDGYAACPRQPDGWHQYAPDTATGSHLPDAVFVSPGYQTVGSAPKLARDAARFERDVQAMVAANPRFQVVTSFNDFVAGSAVESAPAWASDSGFGTYLDVLHRN